MMKRFFYILMITSLMMSVLSVSPAFAEKALIITESGNVGIGTQTPSEKLEVNGSLKVTGRVRDRTGFVMPVGTILPFGGPSDKVPEGWLLCDGSAYDGNDPTYQDLYAVIGTGYGNGSKDSNNNPTAGAYNFNVPDLRGLFLRGVSGATGRDHNRDQRGALKEGGNTGNAVGSYQSDALQGHRHGVSTDAVRATAEDDGKRDSENSTVKGDFYPAGVNIWGVTTDPPYGGVRVSSETRPQNVYVNFIIKY